jgi:hypothetical protein
VYEIINSLLNEEELPQNLEEKKVNSHINTLMKLIAVTAERCHSYHLRTQIYPKSLSQGR